MRTQRDQTARAITKPGLTVTTVGAGAGGTGRSCVAALLATGLAERLQPATPSTHAAGSRRVMLLDPAPAGSSPWPAWIGLETTVEGERPQPARAVEALDLLDVHAWKADLPTGSPEVLVATDTSAQLRPWWVADVLADFAAGGRPALTTAALAVILDGPAGQAADAWWSAHRNAAKAGLLLRLLESGGSDVVVLVVRADRDGLGSALDLVTSLETISVPTSRLVVACVCAKGGASRPAKARMELLRDRVGAVVAVPFSTSVAAEGAVAYARSAERRPALALVDAVLVVAATPGHQPKAGPIPPAQVVHPISYLSPSVQYPQALPGRSQVPTPQPV